LGFFYGKRMMAGKSMFGGKRLNFLGKLDILTNP
jgi:hypothetical protein